MPATKRTHVVLDAPLRLPFRFDHGLVLLKGVTPEGRRLNVEIDTCTSPNVLRHDLVIEEGWPMSTPTTSAGLTADCPQESFETALPELHLGDMKIMDLRGQTDPLGGPASPDVMLGEDFLRHVILTLDYVDRIATITPPDLWSPPSPSATAELLPLELELGVLPCLRSQVTLNEEVRPVLSLLDTGFNDALLLSPALAEELDFRSATTEGDPVEAGGYGGAQTMLCGTIAKLEMGRRVFRDLTAYCPTGATSSPLSDPSWLNIGNGVFRTLRATWALPQHLFLLEERSPSSPS